MRKILPLVFLVILGIVIISSLLFILTDYYGIGAKSNINPWIVAILMTVLSIVGTTVYRKIRIRK